MQLLDLGFQRWVIHIRCELFGSLLQDLVHVQLRLILQAQLARKVQGTLLLFFVVIGFPELY
jgi:hypothetical protein